MSSETAPGWQELPAAYVAACAPDFIGSRVRVEYPARQRRQSEVYEGVLSDAVLLPPGSHPLVAVHPDGSVCPNPLVATVRAPGALLFMAGADLFAAAGHPLLVQERPHRSLPSGLPQRPTR